MHTKIALVPPKTRVTADDLAQFRGSEHFYSLRSNQLPLSVIMTEGVHYLLDQTHCDWVLSEVITLLFQSSNPRIQQCREDLCGLFFTLIFQDDNRAELLCEYDKGDILDTRSYSSIDLHQWIALPELRLWVFPNMFPDTGQSVFWTIMLPSEY